MARYLPVLIALAVVVWAFVECIQTPDNLVRSLPKPLWLVLIIIAPLLGAIGWLFAGRPARNIGGPRRPPSGPRGPDDDPTFLRGL